MKKKTYLALMMAFIIAITASSSYAYFNGKAIISRANGESLNTLTIQNGNEKIYIDTGNANWIYNGVEGNEINDPNRGSSATYSGIKVSNESNLTSNVKLEFSFNSKKDGGSIEDENAKPPEDTDEEDKREPAEKFEVLVGDIDRFNHGYGSTTEEQLFAGAKIAETGLNIYPNNDAAGTDRRMVTSGFYNFYQNLSRSSERGDENSKIIIHTNYNFLHYWNYYNIDGEFVNRTTKWPGISPDKNSDGNPKKDEDGLYVYTIEDIIFTNLVLNNNSDYDKTGNLYITEGEWKYDNNQWYKLEEGIWVSKSEIPKMTVPSVETNSYIKNTANWKVNRIINRIDGNAAFYSFTYKDYSLENILYKGSYSIFREEGNIAGPLKTDNGEVFFDGYTDRAMRRMWENGYSANNNEYIQDGVDWGTLQAVQPITFEYNNKIGEKKVTSAFIQMVINDIQAEATEADWSDKSSGGKEADSEWYTSFSGKSNVEYQVTLKIKGDDSSSVRVTEWESEINRLSQHKTVANLISLEFPSRLLHMVEKAEGKGLELLIDDPRDGSEENSNGALIVASGDSYSIDFAKLVVNEKIPTEGLIKGTIKDMDESPISGVKITCNGISEEIKTNENGTFEFKLPAGQVILYLTHPQYVDREYAVNISNGVTADVTIYMTKRENVNIIPKTKFEGYVTITKYKKHEHNNCSDDCKIEGTLVDSIEPDKVNFKIGEAGQNDNKTVVYTDLKTEPGYYYLLDYTVNLFTANEIDDNTLRKFSVEFSSSIKATITQENNPGWSESGGKE